MTKEKIIKNIDNFFRVENKNENLTILTKSFI